MSRYQVLKAEVVGNKIAERIMLATDDVHQAQDLGKKINARVIDCEEGKQWHPINPALWVPRFPRNGGVPAR